MTRSRYGLIAGVASAALAAWWWRHRQHDFVTPSQLKDEVIFSNAPAPTSEGIL